MKKISIILILILLVSCGDQKEVITSNSRHDSIITLLEKHEAFKDAIVTIEKAESKESHEVMKNIDKDYRIIRVDSESFQQDLVLVAYEMDAWNDQEVYSSDDLLDLMPLIYFDEGYVYSIDQNAYDENKSGYDEILEILLDLSYTDYSSGQYKEVAGLSHQTEHVYYGKDADYLELKWQNITCDDFYTRGTFYIKSDDQLLYEEEMKEAVLIEDGIHQIISFDCSKLREGSYKIGIEFERSTVFGLKYRSPNKYVYYSDFRIGAESISRDNESLEGVFMESEYEVYPLGTKEIKVKWINTLKDDMMYGEYFDLEMKEGDQWIKVRDDANKDFAFNAIGYMLGPISEKWKTYQTHYYKKLLDKGSYRIVSDFHRKTLDGVDFGPGNYPNYKVAAYFEIGDSHVKRDMTSLKDGLYTYYNDEFDFLVDLPSDWQGLNLVRQAPDKESPLHDILYLIDSNYFIIRLSHPNKDFQEIVFTVIDVMKWNENCSDVVDGDFSLLPESIYSDWTRIFKYDPYYYDKNKDGYDEVREIIFNHVESY